MEVCCSITGQGLEDQEIVVRFPGEGKQIFSSLKLSPGLGEQCVNPANHPVLVQS